MKIKSIPNPSAPTAAPQSTRIIKMKTQQEGFRALVAAPEAPANPVLAAPGASPVGLSEAVVESTPEATQALSPQYTALAKRERALRKLNEEIKQRESAFKAQSASSISLEDLKKDPFGALNKAGVTYEQLTQLPAAESQDPLQAKIEALEAKLESFDKRSSERDTQDYAQAIKVIEGDATLLVNSDPAFETIKATGNVKEVVRLIEKIYETEGTILDVTEAAKMVEEKLAENVIKQYQTFGSLKKVQAKLNPPVDQALQQSQPQSSGKTLTNAMGAQRPLSARERAILAFNNKLK